MIAADTVEEKVLHLQAEKRHLANGLLAADRGPMEKLTAEELCWLLS